MHFSQTAEGRSEILKMWSISHPVNVIKVILIDVDAGFTLITSPRCQWLPVSNYQSPGQ